MAPTTALNYPQFSKARLKVDSSAVKAAAKSKGFSKTGLKLQQIKLGIGR